jgi:thermitase
MLFELVLCSVASGDFHAPLPRPAAAESGAVHPTRLLIQPVAGADPAALELLHQRLGAHVLRELPAIRWQIVEVDPERLADTRSQYAQSALVAQAEFDHARQLAYTPNDPYYPGMWNLPHMRVDTVWDTTRGSSSVLIAVIDTGCERTHPDLAANVWVNPGEIPNNGIDDDGDGLVDDVSGWDFVNNDNDPDDVFGHGTGTSGIVAAVQDNNLGVTGIAPLCKFLQLKACNDSGYLFDSYVVPALLYAADRGAKVISMSFYGDQVTPAERDAIDYCWSHGALPIAAAGNDAQTFPYYPGAYEHTLGVGSHNGSDQKSWFSNWGSWVDVASPGEGLSTTWPGGGYTTGFTGTSAACPDVAGVAALLFAGVPGATNAQVRAALEDTAIGLNQPPYGVWANYGRIDAQAALNRLLGQTSGSKPPRLLFASPVGGGLGLLPVGQTGTRPELLVYGVGLEQPNVVRLLRNGSPLQLLSQSRNEVHANLGSNLAATLGIEVNAQVIQSLRWDTATGWLFAPSDANTRDSGSTTGGFLELYRDDGNRFTCTRDPGNQRIFVQLALRKVRGTPIQRMRIEWTRSYTNCNGGTETVDLYDWQSASYPYGSFVTISSQAISTSNELRLSAQLPANPGRFIDPEGTVYVQITATNAGSNALLSMDSFRLHLE